MRGKSGCVVALFMWGPPCSMEPTLPCHSPSGSLQTSPSQICLAPPTAPSPPQLRAPWLSGCKERDPVLPRLPWAGGRHPQALPASPHRFGGAVWEGVEGLPTCMMKSQSSTSKAMSFTPSPCFTRCSPISAQSRNSHRHEQNCFALPQPFPTPSPLRTPTLIAWVQSRRENKNDLSRKRRNSEDGTTGEGFHGANRVW